jgi:regulator of RNase E activity RraA
MVSHAYVHMVDFGTPVTIGGLEIRSGDLIHADRHGVQVIPPEIARAIPDAAEKIIAQERKVISLCQSPGFALEELKKLQP